MIFCDVSYYQNQPSGGVYKAIDWDRMMKQGASGVWIKASQGLWPDRQFITNWKDAKPTMYYQGAYHFFNQSIDAVKQADFFLGMIETAGGSAWTAPPALDLEWTSALGDAAKPRVDYQEKVTAFVDRVHSQTGQWCVIYSSYSHILTYLPRPLLASRYDVWANLGRLRLWIAQYHSQKTITLAGPNVPRPWVDWYAWQCCVSPDSLILTSDLRWIQARDLEIGQELISFDEDNTIRGLELQRSIVLRNEVTTLPGIEFTLADGKKIKCATGHPFLSRTGNKSGTIRTNIEWRTAGDILGMKNRGIKIFLPKYFEPWVFSNTYESGYLAGAFDGEGSLSMERGNAYHAQFAQKDNEMLSAVLSYLDDFEVDYQPNFGNHGTCYKVYVRGGKASLLKFIGEIRPPRLLQKVYKCKELGTLVSKGSIEIVEAEYLGDIEVSALTTSNGTYFSDGFASHNSADGNGLGKAFGVWSTSIDVNRVRDD